ncbi:UDP-N-acetylglucosamine 1-carboxyvinyltransferase [Paenibacillus amylolyticus]|jgi:UDP-N-acetylglucosamine 1-carboxyvinyltransferase|uniref:UDP-N-acetylglucosamine 1-carboxyvinyltransferase n=2 Tax=Paenibacillus amylolyticus TaxID=1451 RepID=A0A1R1BT10_PAEAM|nr:UDP-N-acetylglucosamine 1-carboxyvinyltransferase [Paenibacillus xylanexedens]KAA8749981.1 UDP-N-acetylglucosamine 1-carboxyvinyltransferase [Paenibacillus sp. UASWS1643]MDQ0723994.1 UDP-N-acetylglucosamine 1-carboxyvinyltransferase [Paenibacillus sp. W4I10]MDR6720252.1 UDP-N-acetylglucosamine 1-carboxyvinyltransferase [Paenibacillus sp. 2003]OMF13000.1 UDP-N-acetylglucosamine 1-carboxyvinyltransferase [Paenibacillus amylolyticus]SDD39346.1 UDP-N-acetylglucosamine 1-carboxyvinyltransferase 
MMSKFIVRGGKRLTGSVKVSGAKNSVLPIIAASLLGEEGQSVIIDAPPLDDVMTINKVLESLGAGVTYRDEVITVNAEKLTSCEAPYEWVSKMRASFLVMGPLLTRMGHTRISLPGGCAIGTRPIDQHLKGFEAMGAEISLGQGYIEARSQGRLRGAKIYLDVASVGATQNIMMAATLAEGVTVLENAAKEPEIVDLANFLNGMGAIVRGAGTGVIRIEGVEKLTGVTHTVIPDRVEAGTYMAAAAISGGDVYIEGAISDHLGSVIAKLEEMGVTIQPDENGVRVIADRPLKAVDVKTLPYPGFPTDMQSQMMALLLASEGTSVVTETVFENRFMHVDEFQLMNAEIKVEGRSSIITGNAKLKGAKVTATDLRAGAALIIAGLVAEGTTEVGGVHHIDRGYVHLAEKLNGLGADIYRISVDEPKLEATKAPSEKVEKEVPMFKVQPTLA